MSNAVRCHHLFVDNIIISRDQPGQFHCPLLPSPLSPQVNETSEFVMKYQQHHRSRVGPLCSRTPGLTRAGLEFSCVGCDCMLYYFNHLITPCEATFYLLSGTRGQCLSE